jgi:aspartate/methionine/tyrosine aminotransferase
MFSARVLATGAPPIPAARAWAARYRGAAGPALDLTQAVPGYPPPPALLDRLGACAARADLAGYGPIDGEPVLREALAADYRARHGGDVAAADVAITAGANLAFALAACVLAGSGQSVMLPAPWYFNHRMALEAAGIGCLRLPCEAQHGFVPDAARAAALWQEGVRAVVLVSPNNPTGAVYPPEVIARFAELCRARGAVLLLDETYRDFHPGRPHALFEDPGWRERVVSITSFSKAYCVPGARLGAIVAGEAFRAQLAKLLDTWQICPPKPAQHAIAWAIPELTAWREGNRALMEGRAAAFRAAMAGAPAWRVEACGGYFAWVRLPERWPDAEASAERLAAERGLMLLPGPFFGPGGERHLRFAFANAEAARLAEIPARLAG